MSIFPTGSITNEWRMAVADRDRRLETDGVLVRPISGQIYLIEEGDLEEPLDDGTRTALSGLVSRH